MILSHVCGMIYNQISRRYIYTCAGGIQHVLENALMINCFACQFWTQGLFCEWVEKLYGAHPAGYRYGSSGSIVARVDPEAKYPQ